jgi:oxaloacetate decarboxylase alpha subunit
MAVKITETALRDGHQSLIATRLTTDEILGIVEKMDQVGYHAMEVWGGATFDSCLRFLNEDPWERLRQIKSRAKNTKLQMLLRGQNILGYKHYSDDVVEKFIELAVKNGIDIVRIFDALNDVRNLETAIKATKKNKAHCQVAMSYTTSEVHTIDYYVELAKEVEALGADSICIKDMSGIMLPQTAFELVSKLKATVKLEIELHTHATSGTAEMMYLKAIEAGVDIIDTAVSPFSGGTSQPATESMYYALEGTEYQPNLNIEVINEVSEYLIPVRNKYLENGFLNPMALTTNPNILKYQVPGGMLSNLMNQIKEQGSMDKYEDVLKEVPKVRADLGYPPLVTPLSQMVGTQAVMNILTGERYKMIPSEIKDYVKGLYGKSPAPIAKEIQEMIIGDAEVITYRPADDIEPMLEGFKAEIGDLALNEEDVLSYALFPTTARPFFERRKSGEAFVIDTPNKKQNDVPKQLDDAKLFNISVNGNIYEIGIQEVDEGNIPVVKSSATVVSEAPVQKTVTPVSQGGSTVSAPMPGTVLDVKVNVGDNVNAGDTLLILEAMKMENEIAATSSGVVKEIVAKKGAAVSTGEVLIVIG